MRLLTPIVLADRPRFLVGLIGLIIDLAISIALLIEG